MKGGVGKSATVISLAEALAAVSIRPGRGGAIGQDSVLVIDLDAQASASYALAGDETLKTLIEGGKTLDVYLGGLHGIGSRSRLKDFVRPTVSSVTHFDHPLNIALLASCPGLRHAEKKLVHTLTANNRSLADIEALVFDSIRADLEGLKEEYAYIIFDCPPGISFLTEVAIRVSDLVIVPTIPDFLSVLGLDAFVQNLWPELAGPGGPLPPPPHRPHVLITKRRGIRGHANMVIRLRDRTLGRYQQESQIAQRIRERPYQLFEVEVPETGEFSRALERTGTAPTFKQRWGTVLSTTLERLVAEVRERLLNPCH